VNQLCDALRALGARAADLAAGERPLVEYLAQLPAELWDEDCRAVAAFLADHHRALLPPATNLPEPEDAETVAAAAERVQRNRALWQRNQRFAAECEVILEREGTSRVILISTPSYHPRLVAQLQRIPGHRFLKTFKERNGVTLFPTASAVEVIEVCRRHGITAHPDVLALTATTARTTDTALERDADITSADAGASLRVRFPFSRAALDGIKAIPGRHYDKIARDSWLVPAGQLAAVTAFAQRWGLIFHPDLEHEAQQAASLAAWNETQSLASTPSASVPGLAPGLSVAAHAAVEFILRNRSVLLCATPGVPRAAEAMEAVRLRPRTCPPRVLVLCAPESLHHYTIAAKALPHAPYSGGTAHHELIGFDELRAKPELVDELAEWAPTDLVVDETRARLAQAKVLPALTRLGPLTASRGGVTLVIAAAPVLSRPKEVLAFLRILGRLEEFGGERYYLDRFCGRRESEFGVTYTGSSDLPALDDLLRRAGAYMRQESSL